MKLLDEFKAFAMRGNVVDMAVGIIIGAAFGKVVSSFVNNVVMPPLGVLIGGVNFTDLSIVLKEAEGEVAEVAIGYGLFIQSLVDFLIIAAAVFIAVKVMNGMKKKEEAAPAAPPAPSKEELLLGEIRDLLKEQKQG